MEHGLSPVPAVGLVVDPGHAARRPQRQRHGSRQRADDRQHDRRRPPARRRRQKQRRLRTRLLAGRAVASRRRSISGATAWPCRSPITLTGGQISDVKSYAPPMAELGPEPRVLLRDPAQTQPQGPADHRRLHLRLRNLVERRFAKPKHSRRLATATTRPRTASSASSSWPQLGRG